MDSPPHRSATPLSNPIVSQHTSPHSIKQVVAIKHGNHVTLSQGTPRCVLVPTTRSWAPPSAPSRPPKGWHNGSKLGWSRPGSIDVSSTISVANTAHLYFKSVTKSQLEISETGAQISGYQLFVVEKWLVERERFVRTVAVYTGNPEDKIAVTVFAPASTLNDTEAQEVFEACVAELRKDGARPKETEKGILMITSLANFRSDLNIVHIPGGNALTVRNDLFVNINLLRMGCSGRSGLNLDKPSSSSRDKFLQLYSLTEPSALTVPEEWFKSCVLEIVRTVQAALSLCGMFSLVADDRDGLLCDNTVEGMQRWADEIGVYFDLEPMERVLEPSTVAALLSVVVVLKNKLAAIGVSQLPKDPFADPVGFLQSIPVFHKGERIVGVGQNFINYEFIDRVNNAHSRTRQAEPYKVRRVLKNKIEDLTTVSSSLATNLNLSLRSTSEPSTVRTDGWLEVETVDLDVLVKAVTTTNKHEMPATLRDLWGGNPGHHRRERERGEERMSSKAPFFDEDDDSIAAFIWRGTGGKVQKKSQAFAQGIAGWTGIDKGRSKRASTDPAHESDTSWSRTRARGFPPTLVITGDKSPEVTDPEDMPQALHSPMSEHPRSAESSVSEYEHGWHKFNGRARALDLASTHASPMAESDPPGVAVSRTRETASLVKPTRSHDKWPVGTVHSVDKLRKWRQRKKRTFTDDMGVQREEVTDAGGVSSPLSYDCAQWIRRRRSISFLAEFADLPRLKLEYLQIDVELAAQYYLLRDHETDIENAANLMQIMLSSLTETNTRLAEALAPQTEALPRLDSRRQHLTDLTRRGRSEANLLYQRAKTFNYQVDQLEEGTERLDITLEGYRKRMSDVERAVEGLYPLEPYVPPEGDDDAGDDGTLDISESGATTQSPWWGSTLLNWLPFVGNTETTSAR